MKKQLANCLTAFRMVGSLALLMLPADSGAFRAVYVLCGLSDLLDGAAARLTHSESAFGARLDTAADLLFALVCFGKLLPRLALPLPIWVWFGAIAFIKLCNLAFGFVREKKLLSVHSGLNWLTGGLLFLYPLTLRFCKPFYGAAALCAIASAAAVQESRILFGRNFSARRRV